MNQTSHPLKRDRMLRVRASRHELRQWQALAAQAGIPLSDLVRQSLGRVRAWSPGQAESHRERTRQIARIGNNLNQLARWVNTHKRNVDAVQVAAQLIALERDLDRIARD